MKREEGQLIFGEASIPYVLYRSDKRYKTLAIAIDPDEGLVLTAPKMLNLQDIEAITKRKASWIFEKLEHRNNNNDFDFREFVSGETIRYLGRQYILKIVETDDEPNCKLHGKWLVVSIRKERNKLESRIQAKTLIIQWFKNKAYFKLRERLDGYADKMNLSYNLLILADQKKRWGSCDIDGNIRVNWRIIMAPLLLIDYVVVHELCHLTHRDHTPEFWQLLEDHLPDYCKRRKQLKEQGFQYTLF